MWHFFGLAFYYMAFYNLPFCHMATLNLAFCHTATFALAIYQGKTEMDFLLVRQKISAAAGTF